MFQIHKLMNAGVEVVVTGAVQTTALSLVYLLTQGLPQKAYKRSNVSNGKDRRLNNLHFTYLF